jgi:alcohol dehydrogenase (NADP+)
MASFRYKTFGYAAPSICARLQPFSFEGRVLRPNDVAMEILYAGVCYSDLH